MNGSLRDETQEMKIFSKFNVNKNHTFNVMKIIQIWYAGLI